MGYIITVVLAVVPVTRSVVVALFVVAPVTFSKTIWDPLGFTAILESVSPVANVCVSFVTALASYVVP